MPAIINALNKYSNVTTLVTGNAGCLYQIRAGLRSSDIELEILHPVVYLMDRLKKNGSPQIP